jgi:hypothetical protein
MRLRLAAHQPWSLLFAATLGVLLLVSSPLMPRAEGQPLNQQDILTLLHGGVPSGHVSSVIDDRGINFSSSPAFEDQVRGAGGSSSVIDSIRRASQRYEESSRPRTGGLVVKSTPGETEVYLNDELKGMTSPEGELRIPELQPGDYKLRVSSLGYKSFEQTVSVSAGDDQTVYMTLLQRTSPGPRNNPSFNQPVQSGSGLPVPGATVTVLKFFEGPRNPTPEKSDRVYRTDFDRNNTRSIYWELNLAYPAPGQRIDFKLDAIWYRSDGSELFRQSIQAYAMPTWKNSWHTIGYGFEGPGKWTPGQYRVDLFCRGARIASSSFSIY